MNISVSSLGFCGHPVYSMKKLTPEIGIEIFYEWGAKKYWELALNEIMDGRTGTFSIHAPYQGDIVEMSLTDKVEEMYAYLTEPFALYHKYNGTGYVVHMNAPYEKEPTPAEKAERLKRVEDRLAKLSDICVSEGVTLLVENLAYGHGLKTLCDEKDFLGIFERNEGLNCIIDTGHATLGGIDISHVQQTLGGRLMAYHVHDNNGLEDSHRRICTGVIDWKKFGEYARKYTPDANFVMEYNALATDSIDDYMADAAKLRELVEGE